METTDINVAHKLLSHFQVLAWERLKDTVWWKTSPKKDITLQIKGIEYRETSGLYSRGNTLFVVAVATAGNGESQEILIPIEEPTTKSNSG